MALEWLRGIAGVHPRFSVKRPAPRGPDSVPGGPLHGDSRSPGHDPLYAFVNFAVLRAVLIPSLSSTTMIVLSLLSQCRPARQTVAKDVSDVDPWSLPVLWRVVVSATLGRLGSDGMSCSATR